MKYNIVKLIKKNSDDRTLTFARVGSLVISEEGVIESELELIITSTISIEYQSKCNRLFTIAEVGVVYNIFAYDECDDDILVVTYINRAYPGSDKL